MARSAVFSLWDLWKPLPQECYYVPRNHKLFTELIFFVLSDGLPHLATAAACFMVLQPAPGNMDFLKTLGFFFDVSSVK